MPYYSAGDYYRGDYYRGDILGVLKKIGGAVLKVGGTILGATPVGAAAKRVIASVSPQSFPQLAPPGMIPKPGMGGTIERFLPGGDSGYYKRRRMNVTNVRALRRAGRRVKGFLKLANSLGALPVNRGKGKQLFKRKARR